MWYVRPAKPDQSFCLSFEYSMTFKLLTEHHLEFLSLKGGCKGSSESTLVKMSNCWKSHAAAQFIDFHLFTVRHPSERTTSASRSSRTGKRQSQAHEKRRRDTLMLLF